MTPAEVLRTLDELNRSPQGSYSAVEKAEIVRLYDLVLGRSFGERRCPDRWRDAIIEMIVYLKKFGKMREKSNYRLRAGVVIQLPGCSDVYTNANLTDEVARTYLELFPAAARRFETIPDDAADARLREKEPLSGLNAEVVAEVAARLQAGETKKSIRTSLVGREIGGVNLTHRLVSAYIQAGEEQNG